MHVDVKSGGQNRALGDLGKFLVYDDLPLNDTCDYLPPKQLASYLLVLLYMFVRVSLKWAQKMKI